MRCRMPDTNTTVKCEIGIGLVIGAVEIPEGIAIIIAESGKLP